MSEPISSLKPLGVGRVRLAAAEHAPTSAHRIATLVAVTAAFVIAACANVVEAQTHTSTWTNVTGDWNSASNWDVLPQPGSDTSLIFGGTGAYTSTNNFAGPFVIGQIILNASSGTSTINGNQIQLTGPTEIMQNNIGSFTISNDLQLNGNLTLGGQGFGVVTIDGVISETGGARNLVFKETAKYILTKANTYTGTTTVNGGTLNLQANGALGGGNVTLVAALSGLPVIELQGGFTQTNALSLSGIGLGGRGSLKNVSGNNAWQGTITLAGTTAIASDAGLLTLGTTGTTAIAQGTRALTILGAGNITVDGNWTGTTGTLAKFGAGTLTLNGTSALTTGAKSIRDGQVVFANLNPLGTGAVAVDKLRLAQNPILTIAGANGAYNNAITFGVGSVLRIDDTTAGASAFGRVGDTTAIGLVGSRLEFIGNGAAPTSEDVGTFTFDGASVISITSNTQVATLSLTSIARGANRGTLVINPTAGLLGTTERVRSVGIVVSAPSGLNADGLGSMVAPYYINGTDQTFLTLNGSVAFTNVTYSTNNLESPSTGTDIINAAAIAISGNRSAYAVKATGAITGVGNLLTLDSGGFLSVAATTLTHDVNFRFGATGTSEAVIYTAGAADTIISGTVTTNAGLTKFGPGVLQLNADNAATLSGGIFVNEGTLRAGGAGALGLNTGALTVNGGTLDLNGNAVTMGAISLRNYGTITGAGSLTGTAFTIESGTISADLTGGIGLTKNTSGQAILSAATTFSGATTIDVGSLTLTHANALSGTSGVSVTAAGAAIELSGSIGIAGKTLSITGAGINDDGYANGGALRNISGNNSWTGTITAPVSATIGSDSGLLSLTSVSVTTGALTLTGVGDGAITTLSGGTAATLTKSGSGTWTINSAFTGPTGTGTVVAVTAGTLRIGIVNFLPNTGDYNVQGQTAVLDFQNFNDQADDITVQEGGLLISSGATITTGDDFILTEDGVIFQTGGGITSTDDISMTLGASIQGSGNVTVGDDILLDDSQILGTGAITLGSGDHYNIRSGIIQKTINGNAGGLFTKSTAGSLTLLSSNTGFTPTAGLTINQGVVSWQGRASIGGAINFRPIFLSNSTGDVADITRGTDNVDALVTALVVAEGPLGSFVNAGNTANANSAVNFLKNSTLRFDNTYAYAGGNASGRWFDTLGITLNSGTLELFGNASAVSGETIGTLTYDRGGTVRVLRGAASMTTTLTAGGLTRSGRGTLALRMTAGQLGGDERIFISSGAPTPDAGGIVGPAIFNATDRSFVTYGVNGFANATVTSTNILTSTSTDVVDAGPAALSADAQAHAVRLVGALTNAVDGNTVTISSGGLITDTAADVTHYVNFRFGATGTAEAVLIGENAGNQLFAGTLVTSGGLVKAGSGTVTINADNSSFLTGGVFVNEGVLAVQNTLGLGSNSVTLNGGNLRFVNSGVASNSTITYGNNVIVGSVGISTISAMNAGSFTGNTINLGNLTFESVSSGLNVETSNGYTVAFTGSSNITLPTGSVVIGGPGNLLLAPSGSGKITGAGGIDKQGTGRVTIGGTGHDYTGNVVVRGGTLRLASTVALGAGTGDIIITAGTIEIDTDGFSTSRPLDLGGTGGSGTLRNVSGNNSWNGVITLAIAGTIAADSGTLTIGTAGISAGTFAVTLTGSATGIIAGNLTGTHNLTKDGTGTWTIEGTGSRTTQSTTINAGTLVIRNSTSLGTNGSTSTGAVTVAVGATLRLENDITVGLAGTPATRPLSVGGTGVGALGALRSTGNNSWLGNITLAGGAATIVVDSGTLVLGQGGATPSTFAHGTRALTLGGAGTGTLNGNITASAGATSTLTKVDTGTWILTGTSTRTANNTVSRGTLNLQNVASLGTGTLTVTPSEGEDATLVASGALGTFVNAGNTATNNALTATGSNITYRFDNTTAYAGGLSNGRWFDTQAITLVRGNLEMLGNSAAPSVEVVGATTFDNRSAVRVQRAAAAQTTTITVASLARTNRGTLSILPSVAGQLGTDERFIATTAPTRTTGLNSGADTMVAPFYINATDHSFVTHSGDGTTFMNVAYSASLLDASTATDIIDTAGATITVARSAFAVRTTGAILGPTLELTIGDAATGGLISNVAADTTHTANFRFGSGGAGEALVYTPGAGATIFGGTVTTSAGLTKFGSGLLELSVNNPGLTNGVFVNEGTLRLITTGAVGTNAVTVDASNLIVNAASTTVGALTLRNNFTLSGTGSFTTADPITLGAGTIDIPISATNSVTKSGTGRVTINFGLGSVTTVAVTGVMRLNTATPFTGATGNVSVVSGGAIELVGGVTVSRPLNTLAGTGVGATGALRSISGDNVWTGLITLSGTTSIGVDSGTLSVGTTGSSVNGNAALQLTGSGTGTINGNIATNSTRAVTKNGTGKWTVIGTAVQTSGVTTINAGTYSIRSGTVNGASSLGNYSNVANVGAHIIASNATLEYSGTGSAVFGNSGAGNAVIHPITVSGSGTDGLGAIKNVGGGAVSFLSNMTVNADLTLNGGANGLNIGHAVNGSTMNLGNNSLTLLGLGSIISPITGGTGNLVVNGSWELRGTNTNSSGGASVTAGGKLSLFNSIGLGDNTTSNTWVGVADTGQLMLNNNITVGFAADPTVRALAISGSYQNLGVIGALNSSGTNSYLSNINLLANSLITSEAGTLTVGGANSKIFINRFQLSLGGAGNGTVNGSIHGSDGTLRKQDAGIWTLANVGSFQGGTTVVGGTLRYGVNDALARGAVTVNGAAAVLDIVTFNDSVGDVSLVDGSISGSGGTLTGTSYSVENGSVSAILGGTANVSKITSGTVTFSGPNTYTGTTTITLGTLSISSEQNLGNDPGTFAAGHLTLNGGILATTASFSLDDSNRGVTLGSSGGTFNTSAATVFTVEKAITGAGALTKSGTGVLAINSAANYGGATNVDVGTLSVNGSVAGTGVNVASGAKFNGGASGGSAAVVTASVTVAGGGQMSAGADAQGLDNNGVGRMDVTGNLTWQNGAELTFDFNSAPGVGATNGTNWDYFLVDGQLNVGTGLTLFVDSWVLNNSGYGENGGTNDFNPNQAATNNNTDNFAPNAYQWLWLTANSFTGLTGVAGDLGGDFDKLDNFTVVNTMRSGTGVFDSVAYGPPAAGSFWVSKLGSQLFINYSAVPEPGSLTLVGVGLLGFACRYRRKKQVKPVPAAADGDVAAV